MTTQPAYISMNWRGRPLTSHEVIIETSGAATTRAGLSVHAELDAATYPKGIKIPALMRPLVASAEDPLCSRTGIRLPAG